jgi:hypothetical protein
MIGIISEKISVFGKRKRKKRLTSLCLTSVDAKNITNDVKIFVNDECFHCTGFQGMHHFPEKKEHIYIKSSKCEV